MVIKTIQKQKWSLDGQHKIAKKTVEHITLLKEPEDVFLGHVTAKASNAMAVTEAIFSKIKEVSLETYHVTDNISSDIMHDVYLGVCKYDLTHILKYFIYNKKYFTLKQLNEKIRTFPYKLYNKKNKIPQIKVIHLKQGKLKIKVILKLSLIIYWKYMIYNLTKHRRNVLLISVNVLTSIHLKAAMKTNMKMKSCA